MRTSTKSQRPFGGFTLLEILVALAILGMIMSVVYGSYKAVAGSIVGLQPRIAFEQRGRLFVQCLSRQLRCCYGGRSGRPGPSGERNNDGGEDAVQDGDVLFRGGEVLGDDALLGFVTSGVGLNRELDSGHLQFVSYRFDSSRRILLMYEGLASQPRDNERRDWRTVLENVIEIEFMYFDGTDWYDEWNSAVSQGLPRAVRVGLALESRDGQMFSCRWVVPIACRMSENPKSGSVGQAKMQHRDARDS